MSRNLNTPPSYEITRLVIDWKRGEERNLRSGVIFFLLLWLEREKSTPDTFI